MTRLPLVLIWVTLFAAGGPATTLKAQNEADALRLQVHQQMKRGHQRVSYGATYDILADLYEDPEIPGHLILFYTGRSQDKDRRVGSDPREGWNREHLWPQSRGTRKAPMSSDLHHLKPVDATVNSRRGNLDFDNGGRADREAPDSFFDRDSYEPRDDVKGDVARALFYVDLRYEGTEDEPDLDLIDGSGGQSTLGDLCTLLDWHQFDPADDGERRRNDMIEQIQGNRNLFVDQADLAMQIFGAQCGVNVVHETGEATREGSNTDPTVLRLATWNIANFWHVEGEALRPGLNGRPGMARDQDDYRSILNVIDILDADVIGLQEIGSPESARRLFPQSDWHLVFSQRFYDDLAADPDRLMSAKTRDIYTALAVRRTAASVLKTERIELDIPHEDGRPVREGTAAQIEANGLEFWAASLHLKSGCSFDFDLGRRSDCRTLARQIPILEAWIDEKSAAGSRVALLGDFNRQLDRGNDSIRADLDDQEPVDLYKVPHRQALRCTAYRPSPEISIDYIIVNQALWPLVTVPETPKLDLDKKAISDHCPVFVDLVLGD